MKIYVLAFLFSGTCTTQYCMEVPKIFRHMKWKTDIRELDENKDFTEQEREEKLDEILEYAVDKYTRRKKLTLTPEERASRKLILLMQARNHK
jgi:hypothetical protein